MKRALKILVSFFIWYDFLFRRIILYLQSEKTIVFFIKVDYSGCTTPLAWQVTQGVIIAPRLGHGGRQA